MEIKLGGEQGGIAIVSEEDYNLLLNYAWQKNKYGYVTGKINGKTIPMHRYIMDAPKGKLVDHINGIRHDNRRENLRFGTKQTNAKNRNKINKNKKSSIYKGVYYHRKSKKYRVRLMDDKKPVWIGSYDKELDAAEAYDMYIVHENKEYFTLNFPEKGNEYLNREYISPKTQRDRKTCIYNGVSKSGNYYKTSIGINHEIVHVYHDKDPIVCAKAYDKYIVENNIPNKKLNFPEKYPDYKPIKIIKTKYKIVNNKIIKLIIKNAPDKEVFVDKNEYNNIKHFTWCINGNYIQANINGSVIRLHRFIMKCYDPEIFIDHIDRNTLNNTKNNLRISDNNKNPKNRTKTNKKTTSKYIGVRFDKINNKWLSLITYNNISENIGNDDNEIDAARRRDIHIIINYPHEHYKLNFEWTKADIDKWDKKLQVKTHYQKILMYTQSQIKALSKDNLKYVNKLSKTINKMKRIIDNKYIFFDKE